MNEYQRLGRSLFKSRYAPAMVVLFVFLMIQGIIIGTNGGDPLALARLGTYYELGDPDGTQGYDGQFLYYIAMNPDPVHVSVHLDVPAYRYQRILMPLFARVLSFGSPSLIPWALAFLGVLSHTLGVWAVGELFNDWGINRWYSLIYAFWAGFVLAIVVDLPEPMAYGLVACGLLALKRNRNILGWFCFGLAVFTKEVTLVFVAAVLVSDILNRRWRSVIGLSVIAIFPYFIFQIWLWSVFGQPGLGSGGAMSTSFEWIPFLGFLRIGAYSIPYLLAMLVVFGPTVIWPSIWGAWKAGGLMISSDHNMIVLALFLNSLMIFFLPFSTFRETGGLMRLACGLVMAVLLFAAYYRQKKILNYCAFWLVLNVFLLKPV